MNEAVKAKPGLHWRLGDVADARAMGYLSRREEPGEREREKEVLQVAKLEGQSHPRPLEVRYQMLVLER